MPLPFGFLLGLLIFSLGEVLWAELPLPGVPLQPLLLSCVWVPAAYFAGYLAVLLRARRQQQGRAQWPLLLLCPGVMLLCWILMLWVGRLQEVVDRRVGSEALSLLLCLAPLVLLELLSLAGQQRAARYFRLSHPELEPGPLRLRLVLLVCLAATCFGVLQDLVSLDRHLFVFAHGTTLGIYTMFGLLVLGLALAMPGIVVTVLPTNRILPHDVLYTAGQLGFPARCVHQVETGCRIVNAGLLGLVPGLRHLLLSDGILRLLPPYALRGVVAHEVGHARAAHPLWLVMVFLLLPAFVLPVLQFHLLADLGEAGQGLGLALMLVPGVWLFRRLSHRFEHEADQLSAQALGGAAPTIVALQSISERFDLPRNRASMRHPSEDARIQHLLRWDSDPTYRAAYLAQGRRLRRQVLAMLALAAVVWGVTSLQIWRLERPQYQLYTGDFAGAGASLLALSARLEDQPEPYRVSLRMIQEELDAARSLFPAGGEWSRIRDPLAARARQRGLQVLQTSGPAEARAWFALALVGAEAGPLEACLHILCDAAQNGDEARVAEVRAHLLRNFELAEPLRVTLRLLGRPQ